MTNVELMKRHWYHSIGSDSGSTTICVISNQDENAPSTLISTTPCAPHSSQTQVQSMIGVIQSFCLIMSCGMVVHRIVCGKHEINDSIESLVLCVARSDTLGCECLCLEASLDILFLLYVFIDVSHCVLVCI